MAKTTKNSPHEIVEEGNIYFLYRPRVEHEEAEGFEDVERFYMVLKPAGAKIFRLIVVGKKRLPAVDGHERGWGFVEVIAENGKQVEEYLRRGEYETKTRGERTRPAARPAGEGVYALLRQRSKTHLAYVLELPETPGPVQKAFNIAPQGSFALSIKNPAKGSPPGAGLPEHRQAEYPESLQKAFRDRRFATEDPHLLDYEGAEIILVGARRNPEKAYKVDLEAEAEDEASAEIFKELRFARSRHPAEPLFKGTWR